MSASLGHEDMDRYVDTSRGEAVQCDDQVCMCTCTHDETESEELERTTRGHEQVEKGRCP